MNIFSIIFMVLAILGAIQLWSTTQVSSTQSGGAGKCINWKSMVVLFLFIWGVSLMFN